MNEKPAYVYITQQEYQTLSDLSGNHPFDASDFDEQLIPGFWFARYDEIQDEEWEWADNNSQYIVIKAAAYNESNQIILGPLS